MSSSEKTGFAQLSFIPSLNPSSLQNSSERQCEVVDATPIGGLSALHRNRVWGLFLLPLIGRNMSVPNSFHRVDSQSTDDRDGGSEAFLWWIFDWTTRFAYSALAADTLEIYFRFHRQLWRRYKSTGQYYSQLVRLSVWSQRSLGSFSRIHLSVLFEVLLQQNVIVRSAEVHPPHVTYRKWVNHFSAYDIVFSIRFFDVDKGCYTLLPESEFKLTLFENRANEFVCSADDARAVCFHPKQRLRSRIRRGGIGLIMHRCSSVLRRKEINDSDWTRLRGKAREYKCIQSVDCHIRRRRRTERVTGIVYSRLVRWSPGLNWVQLPLAIPYWRIYSEVQTKVIRIIIMKMKNAHNFCVITLAKLKRVFCQAVCLGNWFASGPSNAMRWTSWWEPRYFSAVKGRSSTRKLKRAHQPVQWCPEPLCPGRIDRWG